MEQRIAWEDLPEPLKQAIGARIGPITDVRIATAGHQLPQGRGTVLRPLSGALQACSCYAGGALGVIGALT